MIATDYIFGHKKQVGEIPMNGLISEWKLEETTGSTFYDSVGINHGTDSNIPNLTTSGKVGNGFYYTNQGYSETIASDDFKANDGTNNLPFSITFLVYIISGGSLSFFIQTNTGHFMGIVSNLLRMEVRSETGIKYGGSANKSVDLGWNHLAYIFNPLKQNPFQIFKNGIMLTMSSNAPPSGYSAKTTSPSIRIGGGNGFDGIIDEVKFYNRALTNQEVNNIYLFEK